MAAIEMLGRAPSNRPGAELKIGTAVTSILDDFTKKYDVYQLRLAAGQNVRFSLTNGRNLSIGLRHRLREITDALPLMRVERRSSAWAG